LKRQLEGLKGVMEENKGLKEENKGLKEEIERLKRECVCGKGLKQDLRQEEGKIKSDAEMAAFHKKFMADKEYQASLVSILPKKINYLIFS
jgi:hypothetical protein